MALLLLFGTVLGAAYVVLLMPGLLVLAATRLQLSLPPLLVPAAAFVCSLTIIALATSATLAARLPIAVIVAVLAVVVVALATLVMRRDGARAATWSFVGGRRLREVSPLVVVIALAGGAAAVITCFYAWGDSLYHIGQAQKLLQLEAPSFSNTLQFSDGSAHPGYLIPVWQEVLALVALIAHADPVEVAWALPAVTMSLAAVTFGGLGATLARSSNAAAPTALAMVLVAVVAPLPLSDVVLNAMHPGTIALTILAPLALALLIGSLWPDERWMRAAAGHVVVALAAVALLGLLHVSYLLILGLGVLGYLLLWTLRAPWPRDVVRRHVIVLGATALVAITCIGALLPGLAGLESFGKDAAAELAYEAGGQSEGKNDANLGAVIRYDVADHDRYHLRPDYLVLGGGAALLGLLALPLALLRPRWPGGWYLSGVAVIVLSVALSTTLFPAYVNVVTLDQARRIEKALPLILGAALAAISVSMLARWSARRGGAGMLGAAALVVVSTGAMSWLVQAVPPLEGYAGARVVTPRVLTSVLVVLLAGTAGGAILHHVHRRRSDAPSGPWWPGSLVDAGTGRLATAMLLVATLPALSGVMDLTDRSRLHGVPTAYRTSELRVFSPAVGAVLKRMPVGSIVLADPRTRDPYAAMAVAPVYVVSSVPRHTANTRANRVLARFRTASRFFELDGMSDRARLQLLVDEHVAAVIIHPRANGPLHQLLRSTPGVRRATPAHGPALNQVIYLVDDSVVARSLTSSTS